jgi:hypothetical protein
MKTKTWILILISVIITGLVIPESLYSQQAISGEISKTYQVTLKDGSTLSGKLVSDSQREIVIQSGTLGEMRVLKENIKSMTLVSAINEKASGVWFENPNASRYLIGSSAIPMENKSGYYQNTWIFFNSFGYAFTRNISLSAGFEIFSIMAGGDGPYAFYLNPKASFNVANNLYLGGSILYANTIRSIDDFGGLATLNGTITYGNKNNNITAAIGWGSSDGEFSSKPVITISGMTRVSKRIGLVSENWILPNIGDTGGYYGIYSYGIRFLGEKISIDLAFINNPDIAQDIIIGIPWLDFVINF